MKLAALAAIFSLALSAQTATINSAYFDASTLVHASRTVEAPGHFYIVDYTYSTHTVYTTAVGCTGPVDCNKVHYDATIGVFEIVSGVRTRIGMESRGQYTVEGCFEDNPLSLVESALAASLTAYPGMTSQFYAFGKWRREEEAHRAFEAMPLYVFADGVLRITDRGKRDIKAIMVNDRAIWGTSPLGSGPGGTGNASFMTDITDYSGVTYIKAPVLTVPVKAPKK